MSVKMLKIYHFGLIFYRHLFYFFGVHVVYLFAFDIERMHSLCLELRLYGTVNE